ncbi:MAG: prepilin peptidase [Methanomicrobiales archaeon]|nr:prepilin peptidase [Methanomicrobiales archaeon]
MILSLVISALAIGITLLYASILDIRERRVPFQTWYPMLIIGIPLAVFLYGSLLLLDPATAIRYLLISALFCGLFYGFAYFRLFGGADAWALIFIAALIPLFPLTTFLPTPPFQFFPFTVLTNAVLLNLAAPLVIFIGNLTRGNHAPLRYLFFGFPVPGDRIGQYYGFVMEDIREENGVLSRRFLTFRESLIRMFRGEDRLYTKHIRMNPEKYRKECDLFRKAGKVWISYGVPFIVPITAGFFSALVAGDILYVVIKFLAGV